MARSGLDVVVERAKVRARSDEIDMEVGIIILHEANTEHRVN